MSRSMANLPTSLRRTMLMLLVGMSMIVMVFYWNQSALKPMSYVSSIFQHRASRNKLVLDVWESSVVNPTENYWTYKCTAEKCVREHFDPNTSAEKRIPFMSCAMICGEPNIWPMPTGRTKVSSRSLTLLASGVSLAIDTKHTSVKQMLHSAFDIFVEDLLLLESNGGASPSNTAAGRRRSSGRTAAFKTGANKKECESDSPADATDGDPKWPQKRQDDLRRVAVKISVNGDAEIHPNLNTDESYNLTLTNSQDVSVAHIFAKSFFGARHALATLQQLIWFDDEDGQLRMLTSAHVEDAPRFRYRGLMLDTSRHYFTVGAIKRTLVGMAAAKLNRFHWHITDSQSFPYVSRHYPQLAQFGAYSSREVYTPDDVREIAEFARVRGIQVVPEIDAPAHAGNGWDWGPKAGLGELSLCINQQPWSFYCGEPPCGQLNPKNNHTYTILQRLYEELLELTGPSDYFHLGGDEVNLECWSQYFNDTDVRTLWCDFMLQAYARLKAANGGAAPAVVAVWSSGLTATQCLSERAFAVQVWGGSTWPENYELLSNGYSIVVSHVDAWYLDCGFGSWRATGDAACSPYRTWQQIYSHRPWDKMHLEESKMKQILGGEACLWTEQVDENALDTRLWPRSAALAERLWTDTVLDREVDGLPLHVFNRFSVFRNRLVDLGLKAEPIFPKYCAQNQHECA